MQTQMYVFVSDIAGNSSLKYSKSFVFVQKSIKIRAYT